jgi:hypothetical protein
MISTKILTPAVEAIASQILASVNRKDRYSLDDYYEMLSHPVVAAYAELPVLLGLTYIQDYIGPTEDIQAEVRASFAKMNGSWMSAVAKAMNYTYYGFSFTERAFDTSSGRAVLDRMLTLDPRRYSFRGSAGGIKEVEYRSTEGNILIPYEEGIHLVNQEHLVIDNSPYGYSPAKRALPYWEAYKIATACLLVACQRQATPITVGKTDITASVDRIDENGVTILDQHGKPIKINQGHAMLKRMEDLENASAIVIGLEDDIEAIAQQGTPAMFESCLKLFERMIALCWLVPETALGSNLSGTGDSGLSEGHNKILSIVVKSNMHNVGGQLIEKIVKPMLLFNYQGLDDFGHFPVDEGKSEDAKGMIEAIAKVTNGAPLQPEDKAVVNRVKALAGIA